MTASLKFGHGDMTGFTGYATSSFNDMPPAKVIRELLQNALDAGVAADQQPTRVLFEVLPVAAAGQLPDISGYERAFQDAVRDNRKVNKGRLTDAAQHVVDTIECALERLEEGDHCMLRVFDNGVGLDATRMASLLGDGSSVKEEGAAGSYGVGHFAAVSASDLRYLLYGGVTKQGRRIAAGFAILAGRFHKKQPLSGRGYLVKKLLGGENGKLYRFMDRKEIPAVVDAALDKIRDRWRHGSCIMIPAFNYFGRPPRSSTSGDSSWLSDVVTRVVAYNFSAAIHSGDLVVDVDETATGGSSERLDAKNLGRMLERDANHTRRYRSDSPYRGLRPSGQSAYAAYQALARGYKGEIATSGGEVSVHLLTCAPTGATRLDLFRNGMWITDDIPGLARGVFADNQPFHAVLMPVGGTTLHRLVRKAEGPMHDQLVPGLLSEVEQEQLHTAIRAIAAWLKTRVPKVRADTYTPDDFLVVSTGGDGGPAGTTRYEMWGSPVVVQRPLLSQRVPDDTGGRTDAVPDGPSGERGGSDDKRRRTEATRRSQPLPFRCTAVPGERGAYNIEVECREPVDEVLLRFRIDENADATCDRLWPDEAVVLKAFEATGQGGAKLAGELEDDHTVRLRGLTPGTHQVAIEYEVPQGFEDAVQSPVFRVDLHKPQA